MIWLYRLIPGAFGVMIRAASGLEGNSAKAVVVLAWVITAASAYLLGSLNFGIIVSKKKFGQDIRSFGSGNAGLTNMHRVYGKEGALLTLAGDIGKQVASVVIGAVLASQEGAYLAGLFCILGHIFPVYYHFRGGKGVLTAATMILLLDPLIFLVLFVVFALVLLITRYVSLASVIAAMCYPAAVYYSSDLSVGRPTFSLVFALFVGALVIFMHRSNIYRIFNNQESKFSFHKKKDEKK